MSESAPALDLNPTYGAMLIGLLCATFLQGMLSVQTYVYYQSFPGDPRKTKLIVATVWCMDTIHFGLIAQAVYHYLITNWGNTPALMYSTWELDLNLAFIGLSSFACQTFFLHRIWIFSSRNIVLVVVLTCMCLTTLILDLVVTAQIISVPLVTEFGARKAEIIAVFTSGAATDLTIALLLCYYLRRGRSGFERTNSLVDRVIQSTISTGLATSLLAIGSLIAYFARPDGFIFIAIHFSLGRMYTNALLATLNSRRNLPISFGAAIARNQLGSKPDPPRFAQASQSSAPQYMAENIALPLGPDYEADSTVHDSRQAPSPEYSLSLKGAHDQDIELGSINGKANLQ